MTHKDIYTKFMIEYDKANVTSSYPSLTPYEIATLLDKAYLAVIAQKVTGNNPRQAPFEADIKAIEDIRPLIVLKITSFTKSSGSVTNRYQTTIPDDSLYLVSSQINLRYNPNLTTRPMDSPSYRVWPIQFLSHDVAQRFFATPYNMPWIKQPVSYIEGDTMYILVDSMWNSIYDMQFAGTTSILYIKYPAKFALSIPKLDPIPDDPDDGGDTPSDAAIKWATAYLKTYTSPSTISIYDLVRYKEIAKNKEIAFLKNDGFVVDKDKLNVNKINYGNTEFIIRAKSDIDG